MKLKSNTDRSSWRGYAIPARGEFFDVPEPEAAALIYAGLAEYASPEVEAVSSKSTRREPVKG